MAEPILTAEELDEILSNKPETQSEYEAAFARIAASKLALRNKRTQVKTLEDTLDAYEGLLADARKIVEEGLAKQLHRLKELGRVGILNFQWGLDVGFSPADWLIRDHEGPQVLRNRVLAADYGHESRTRLRPLNQEP